MPRVTYQRQAEGLAHEIAKTLIQQGATTFCLLRSDEQGRWGLAGEYSKRRYWLSFTRMSDGSLEHTTSVFADNPKDAAKYLKGFLDAVCLQNGKF